MRQVFSLEQKTLSLNRNIANTWRRERVQALTRQR